MKIQCDVCNKDEASVFCSADEAALCDACDHRVHHANKLAGKHHRFSLLHPSTPKQFPLCDICQEKRAFLFCQQDRAIMCRDCDLSIHKANEHTQKHNRFLLTGVKLSATSSLYSSPSSISPGSDRVPNLKPRNSTTRPISPQPAIVNPPSAARAAAAAAATTDKGLGDNQLSGSTSSISEYLIETLPGWHVEDFLESSDASFGFCKTVDDVLPIWDTDLESNLSSFSSQKNMGICVPQASPPVYRNCQYPSADLAFGGQIGLKEANYSGRNWRDDSCFTVPQISPASSTATKRSRIFW